MCKYKYVFFECGCFAGRIRDETQPLCEISPAHDESESKEKQSSVYGRVGNPLPSASGAAAQPQPICQSAAPLPQSFAMTTPCGGCPASRRKGEVEVAAAVIAGEVKLRQASSDGELANRRFFFSSSSSYSRTGACATNTASVLPAAVEMALRDNVFAVKEAEREAQRLADQFKDLQPRTRAFFIESARRRRARVTPFETGEAEAVEGEAFDYASRIRDDGAVMARREVGKAFRCESRSAAALARADRLCRKGKWEQKQQNRERRKALGATADAAIAKRLKV